MNEENLPAKFATVETRWWRLWITIPLMRKLKRTKWLVVRFLVCRRHGHDFTNCDSGMMLNQSGKPWMADQWCVRCQKLCQIPFAESKYAKTWIDSE